MHLSCSLDPIEITVSLPGCLLLERWNFAKVSLYGRETDHLRSACRCVACFYLFSPNEQCGGWGGGMLPDFFFCSLFPVQQTTSGIGHRVKLFFRVGNQCAECEKQ